MNLENDSHTLDTELNKVYNLIISKRLALNTYETHFMISSPLMAHPIRIIVKINILQLIEVHKFTFLEIIIESKLKWNEQIQSISINRHRKNTLANHILPVILNANCIRQVYLELIYPHKIEGISINRHKRNTFANHILPVISNENYIWQVYLVLIYPHCLCCSAVWGGAY